MDGNLQFGSTTAVKAAIIQETKIITIYTNNFMVIKSDILYLYSKTQGIITVIIL
jgi:ribosomal protein L30E